MEQTLHIEILPVGPIQANCYVLHLPGRNDCVLVDPGDEPERILASLHGKKVAAVLLTHGHFDHIGGVHEVMEQNTEVYIHPLDEPMLLDPAKNMAVLIGSNFSLPAKTLSANEGDMIIAAGIHINVLHTPGHTPGSVCYLAESALFSGDTMFSHGYGRTDLPGGSFHDLYLSLKRLIKLPKDTKVYPGHDIATTIGIEKERFT